MKKSIITSLLILAPAVVMAADHCTNPDEYTIDRRCYVPYEQKTQKPYNAVVALLDKNSVNDCTGTIVKENNNYYIYTARHCIKHDNWSPNGINSQYEDTEIYVRLQNNQILKVKRHRVETIGDWVVYKIADKDINAIADFATTKTDNMNSKNAVYDARVVGYGALKVMSDKEISDFKKAYEKYLVDEVGEEYMLKERNSKEGIKVAIGSLKKEWPELINDVDKLKESVCDYYVRYGADGCQGWQGNSGGPVFDSDGKIMAILTHGQDVIGGDDHARIGGGAPGTDGASTVSLLKGAVVIKE